MASGMCQLNEHSLSSSFGSLVAIEVEHILYNHSSTIFLTVSMIVGNLIDVYPFGMIDSLFSLSI